MNLILNLTQHKATVGQVDVGVWDLNTTNRARLIKLLTFDEMPSKQEMIERALLVAKLAREHDHFSQTAMIGGAPYFMGYLEAALKALDIKPVYAFSKRVTVEVVTDDNEITKISTFKHEGFIEA